MKRFLVGLVLGSILGSGSVYAGWHSQSLTHTKEVIARDLHKIIEDIERVRLECER